MCVLFDEPVGFEEAAALLELTPSPPFRRMISELLRRLPVPQPRPPAPAPGTIQALED
jgi:hypothetical protein